MLSRGLPKLNCFCLNSRESFEHNKQCTHQPDGRNPSPDSRPDSRIFAIWTGIQSRTATRQEFVLLVRAQGGRRESTLPEPAGKDDWEQKFTVRQADWRTHPRLLRQRWVSEDTDDRDGQRWLMKDGRSEASPAPPVLWTRQRCFRPFWTSSRRQRVRFRARPRATSWAAYLALCVWAVRGYPFHRGSRPSSSGWGMGRRYPADHYTGWYPGEGRKILQARTRPTANKSGKGRHPAVEAQSNLEDALHDPPTQRNREPLFPLLGEAISTYSPMEQQELPSWASVEVTEL